MRSFQFRQSCLSRMVWSGDLTHFLPSSLGFCFAEEIFGFFIETFPQWCSWFIHSSAAHKHRSADVYSDLRQWRSISDENASSGVHKPTRSPFIWWTETSSWISWMDQTGVQSFQISPLCQTSYLRWNCSVCAGVRGQNLADQSRLKAGEWTPSRRPLQQRVRCFNLNISNHLWKKNLLWKSFFLTK